jgi:hypothetical protein
MKVQIKSSILIITLLLGITLSQGTAPAPAQQQNSTSGVLPSGSNSTLLPVPTGVRPSGSPSGPKPYSGLRGESGKKPEGPSNIPPKDGGYSDKLAAISDERIQRLKNVLKFLPLTEQDLLAGNF